MEFLKVNLGTQARNSIHKHTNCGYRSTLDTYLTKMPANPSAIGLQQ